MKRKAHDLEFLEKIGAGQYGDVYNSKIRKYGDTELAVKILLDGKDFDYYMPANIKELMIGGSACKLRKEVITYIRGRSYGILSVRADYTLSQIAPNNIPIHAVRIIGFGILKELNELHNLGIMHRDLKPDNIMISGKWPPKVNIIDFGLSTCAQKSNCLEVISLWWRPPEILYGTEYSNKVDIWSFGVILYNLICPDKFITAKNVFEAQEQIWTRIKNPENLNDYKMGNLMGFEHIILKCLDANPFTRADATNLLLDDFWNLEPSDSELKDCLDWYEKNSKRLDVLRLREKEQDTIKLSEGKDYNFSYTTNFDENLYKQKCLYNMTSSIILLCRTISEEMNLSESVFENAILFLDRFISESVFPPQDIGACISASFYISCCLYSDYVPKLSKFQKCSKAASTSSIEQAVMTLLSLLNCKLISYEDKKFVKASKKWEKIMCTQ